MSVNQPRQEFSFDQVRYPVPQVIPEKILKGNDELKIRVSNLMANRITDLDKKGFEWRRFYNTNFNARKKANAGKDGKFSAAGWNAKDAGIYGMVTLSPLILL